jgi:hypothetical protein
LGREGDGSGDIQQALSERSISQRFGGQPCADDSAVGVDVETERHLASLSELLEVLLEALLELRAVFSDGP